MSSISIIGQIPAVQVHFNPFLNPLYRSCWCLATCPREKAAIGRDNKQLDKATTRDRKAGVTSTFLPRFLSSSYSPHPNFPLPTQLPPPLLWPPSPSLTALLPPPRAPCPSAALPSCTLPSWPSLPLHAQSIPACRRQHQSSGFGRVCQVLEEGEAETWLLSDLCRPDHRPDVWLQANGDGNISIWKTQSLVQRYV